MAEDYTEEGARSANKSRKTHRIRHSKALYFIPLLNGIRIGRKIRRSSYWTRRMAWTKDLDLAAYLRVNLSFDFEERERKVYDLSFLSSREALGEERQTFLLNRGVTFHYKSIPFIGVLALWHKSVSKPVTDATKNLSSPKPPEQRRKIKKMLT